MGHFSFGVFLLDFWLFSELQAQSLVASKTRTVGGRAVHDGSQL